MRFTFLTLVNLPLLLLFTACSSDKADQSPADADSSQSLKTQPIHTQPVHSQATVPQSTQMEAASAEPALPVKSSSTTETNTASDKSAKTDSANTHNSKENDKYKTIQWTELLPQSDLDALLNPPEYLDDIEDGSEADTISGQLKNDQSLSGQSTNAVAEDLYQQALASTTVIPEFDGKNIRIPGFIVPLEFDDEQVVTTFFLVPFFGACIHQPPPPPNQIMYAEYEPGKRLEALYDAFWIEGKLTIATVENSLAKAAYSIDVVSITPYYDDTE